MIPTRLRVVGSWRVCPTLGRRASLPLVVSGITLRCYCSTGTRLQDASSSPASSSCVEGASATVRASPAHGILSYPLEFVNTLDALESASKALQSSGMLALDVEALCTSDERKQLGTISLIQACSDAVPVVYVFDVLTLKVPRIVEHLGSLMENEQIVKLFFDCRRDVEALSCQCGLQPTRPLDLQLYYSALQWKLRSVNRRSGMKYVLSQVSDIERPEGDQAVQTAMTVGNRPVWDVRPLPPHFLEYAAADVRHTLFLASQLSREGVKCGVSSDLVERLTARYVEHYALGSPVLEEADPQPTTVNVKWLERYIGPGGVCKFCGSKGHTEAECFKKKQNGMTTTCTFCGMQGHTVRHCFRKFPELLKCEKCGQLGHNSNSCYQNNPCKHCGGRHHSDNCHKSRRDIRYFD